ncbi:MAG TPA: DUF3006 domain-containing protein [Firmicutes bacterium]|jgi:hypothetical protein|nr:DUF3006 domain-containing protein [Bacillota bacterium]HBL50418.1 DUF3006 domain-containing protein [Bacillota bacterium]HCX70403.1 DUF3006 domain-containing protein [Bacillota bacterium]
MEIQVFYDRRETDWAVLLVGDCSIQVDWPAELLPEEALPGQYLKFTLAVDPKSTQDAKIRIEDLIKKLLNK